MLKNAFMPCESTLIISHWINVYFSYLLPFIDSKKDFNNSEIGICFKITVLSELMAALFACVVGSYNNGHIMQ